MQFTRERGFTESEIIKGFDGRGNVKSAVLRAAGIKGENEVQQVFLQNSPTGGTYTLTFEGQTTTALAWNANNAAIIAALEALSNIGVGEATVTGGPLPGAPIRVEFKGALAASNRTQMTGSGTALTGGGLGDSHDVLVTTVRQGHAAGAADGDGDFIVYEGTIMTVDPANPTKVIEYTAGGSEVILGILAHRVELFSNTSPQYDRAVALFWHNCVFDRTLIKNYGTYGATAHGGNNALITGLPTCRFE